MKVVRLFSKLFDERMNVILEKAVTKDELKIVLQTFKMANSPGPNGWMVELYLGFY